MGDMLAMVGLSAASSAANAAGNYLAIDAQSKAQKEMQQEQNQFQAAENEKDRDWQSETWLQHFLMENDEYAKRLGLQQKQWQSQFDIANVYNAPSAQMARLKSAGINPSAMMQNSGLASLGQSSASPSASSSVQPSTTPMASHGVAPASAPSFGGLSSQAANFTSIAQMADSVSKLQQVGLNSDRQKAMLQAEVDKALSEAALNQQKTILSRIEAGVAANWSDKTAAAQYQKLINDSYAAFTAGDLNKANELVSQANERLISLQSEIKAEMFPQELANLKALQDVYRSERTKNIAAANASNASAVSSISNANYMDALSETENRIRDGKVTSQDLSNGVSAITFMLQSRENQRDIETNRAKVYAILEECRRQGFISEQELQKAKILQKDLGSYEFRTFWSGLLSKMPNVVVPFKP